MASWSLCGFDRSAARHEGAGGLAVVDFQERWSTVTGVGRRESQITPELPSHHASRSSV